VNTHIYCHVLRVILLIEAWNPGPTETKSWQWRRWWPKWAT